MRFYQLEYLPADGALVAGMEHTWTREWFSSDREAVVRRLELLKMGKLRGKKSDAKIWPFDIPVDKRGLLAFLRAEAV